MSALGAGYMFKSIYKKKKNNIYTHTPPRPSEFPNSEIRLFQILFKSLEKANLRKQIERRKLCSHLRGHSDIIPGE